MRFLGVLGVNCLDVVIIVPGGTVYRDLEANDIPILWVFLPVFGVAASVTESQLYALRRALKTNQNPAS